MGNGKGKENRRLGLCCVVVGFIYRAVTCLHVHRYGVESNTFYVKFGVSLCLDVSEEYE